MPKDSDETRREKKRAIDRRYRAEHKAERLAYQREYRAKHKAQTLALQRKRNLAHAATWMREYRARKAQGDSEYWKKKWIRERERKYATAWRPPSDVCDICGGPPRGGRNGKLQYDHCHKRGHWRGWLCNRCNTVLGYVEDDPRLLMQMAAYLQRTRVHTSPQLMLSGI